MKAPPRPAFDGSQLCAKTDPEVFHPPSNSPGKDAVRICQQCPWLEECLEWAIWQDVEGIWGGRGTRWRARERRRRGIPAAWTGRTAELVRRILAADPAMVASELALELGCSEKTVQRHRAAARAREAA